MNLEDHQGDIIQKARQHAEVSLAEAAKAAALSVPELEALEARGVTTRAPDYAALGSLLGLDASKLARVARGWLPQPVDLSRWRELRPVASNGMGFSVNAYLIWDEVTREAALFDTGFDGEAIIRLIDEYQLQLRHVFVTHGHADHIGAIDGIRARFPKVRLHSGARQAPVEQRIRTHDCISLGSLRITNRDTPGHTEDGVTYVVGTWPEDAPPVAIVGDALFAGSMGRAVGNAALARRKIRDQVLSLPSDTLICPGHGPLTTVAEEKANNPFF